jgi:hypothetical protein
MYNDLSTVFIDQLGFGNMDKIILQFHTIFWNKKWAVLYLADAPFLFSRESYLYFTLNSSIQTMKLLAKECTDNQLFWAGEHMNSEASVHTTFATGKREVKKILNRRSMKINHF